MDKAESPTLLKVLQDKFDAIVQTVLTFPPNLPKEVEDFLAPYFSFHDNQQLTHELITETDMSIHHDARNASLRRELLECANYSSTGSTVSETNQDDSIDSLELSLFSSAPGTPEIDKTLVQNLEQPLSCGPQRISIDLGDISFSPMVDRRNCSFGALSPISRSSVSPSPLQPDPSSTELPDHSAIYRSTPVRLRSANGQINSSVQGGKQIDITMEFTEKDIAYKDNPLGSTQSSYSVLQYPTTPFRRRSTLRERRRNRINRTFLIYSKEQQVSEKANRDRFASLTISKENVPRNGLEIVLESSNDAASYRTDSGFNETRVSQDTVERDASMKSECSEWSTDTSTLEDFIDRSAPTATFSTVERRR